MKLLPDNAPESAQIPCEFDNCTLLVICDYYSNYVEVARLNTTSRSVIREMKAIFARCGILDIVVMDRKEATAAVLLQPTHKTAAAISHWKDSMNEVAGAENLVFWHSNGTSWSIQLQCQSRQISQQM